MKRERKIARVCAGVCEFVIKVTTEQTSVSQDALSHSLFKAGIIL